MSPSRAPVLSFTHYFQAPATQATFAGACSAILVVCYTLVDLGYFIGLKKSHLVPKQVVSYLGFLVDSVHQAFLLLEEKNRSKSSFLFYALFLARLLQILRHFSVSQESVFPSLW